MSECTTGYDMDQDRPTATGEANVGTSLGRYAMHINGWESSCSQCKSGHSGVPTVENPNRASAVSEIEHQLGMGKVLQPG
ncbi:hypothetical protein Tco_0723050 [Tanacetum coccineum]|uniref:Uncharacterized protein n=1 Tax=Tanacetum coccineum TaxID=301880 RepID=A0ABQ5D837_9ASTR